MATQIPPLSSPLGGAHPVTVSSPSMVPVLLAGLVTTALSLGGIWAINRAAPDVNVMGWYAYYVFPLGALMVGLAAGSGYGVASWLTGVRIRTGLLALVILLQVLAYFVATYIEYLQWVDQVTAAYGSAPDLGFLGWFHELTVQFAFKKEKGGGLGAPMGMWGYAFRLLEVAGFAVGGILAPLFLKGRQYCEACQMYMRQVNLGLWPASLPAGKFKRKDTEGKAAHAAESLAVREQSLTQLDELRQHAEAGRSGEFGELLEGHAADQKAYSKLPERLSLALWYCRGCNVGRMQAAILAGQGNQIKRVELGFTPVDKSVVRQRIGS